MTVRVLLVASSSVDVFLGSASLSPSRVSVIFRMPPSPRSLDPEELLVSQILSLCLETAWQIDGRRQSGILGTPILFKHVSTSCNTSPDCSMNNRFCASPTGFCSVISIRTVTSLQHSFSTATYDRPILCCFLKNPSLSADLLSSMPDNGGFCRVSTLLAGASCLGNGV